MGIRAGRVDAATATAVSPQTRSLAAALIAPVVFFFDRFAWFGMRSQLLVWLATPESGGGLGMTREAASELYSGTQAPLVLGPLLAGVLACFLPPMAVGAVGGLVSIAGFGLLVSGNSVSGALWLAGFGSSALVACLYATLAQWWAEPRENGRNAAFTALYLAVNVAALVSAQAGKAAVEQLGSAGYKLVFASAAAMSGVAMVLAIALTFLTLRPPEAPKVPMVDQVAGLVVAVLVLPLSGIASVLADRVAFTELRAEVPEAYWLLNPSVVTALCLVMLLLFFVGASANLKLPSLFFVGAGLLVTGVATAMALVPGALLPQAAIGAAGEALLSPVLLALACSRVPVRWMPLAAGAVVAWTRLSFQSAHLFPHLSDGAVKISAGVAAVFCLLAGLASAGTQVAFLLTRPKPD